MGALALFREVLEFIALSTTPTRETRQAVQSAAHLTYFLCPALAIPFFLTGLHGQWMPGYVIAAALTIIPMVLLELARRMAKAAFSTAEKFINLAATPHTWFAISNFWLALLAPADEYIPLVYLVVGGITIFLVLMGRWDRPARWYKAVTIVAVVLPTAYSAVIVIGGSLAPATVAGVRSWLPMADTRVAQTFGSNFDQNIGRSAETAIGRRDDKQTPVTIAAGELLWRTPERPIRFADGVYYARFLRQSPALAMQPDPRNAVWFPETKVVREQAPVAKVVTLPANVNYRPDNRGQPGSNIRHTQVPVQGVEVTSRYSYVDGKRLYFGRLHDRDKTYHVWWEVQYEAL